MYDIILYHSWELVMIISDETKKEINRLKNKYKVKIDVVNNDSEYYSDHCLLRTIRDKIFFISNENPIQTSITTEILIREKNLRNEVIHENRVQKAASNRAVLAKSIAEIRQSYEADHDGKTPSMNKIAQILNQRSIDAPSGNSKWYAETVKRIIDRTHNGSPDGKGQER